jgi:hypothetical protein
LRLPLDEAVATIARLLARIMLIPHPAVIKGRASSRLKATHNQKRGFTCTPAKPLIYLPYLFEAATFSIMPPNER